ncbi:hypothetical protein COE51_18200 [Bacillus pseudomycoides]|nr:hypothetical protein COE51_18200 [Bacillus pseudomycoides]
MGKYTVKRILDGLKIRLDNHKSLMIQNSYGEPFNMNFTFHEPVQQDEIDIFTAETGITISRDYQELLLLHNGAIFFLYEYGYSFCLYSLDKIKTEYECLTKNAYYEDYRRKNGFPIGYFIDTGWIWIDKSKYSDGGKYMMLDGIEVIDFRCNFKTWLDRIIRAQGDRYWEWYSKIVYLDH